MPFEQRQPHVLWQVNFTPALLIAALQDSPNAHDFSFLPVNFTANSNGNVGSEGTEWEMGSKKYAIFSQ